MSDLKAKLIAVGGLVAIGLIATAPIGAPLVFAGVSLNPLIWGVVIGSSIGAIAIKPKK